MGRTIVEKIIGDHAGLEVRADANSIVETKIDVFFSQDGNAMAIINEFKKLEFAMAANPRKTFFFIERSLPASSKEIANDHKTLRQFVNKAGRVLSDIGYGIGNIIIDEQLIKPGDIAITADSNSGTGGALGAYAIAVSPAEMAQGMVAGKCRLNVPGTFKIYVTGEFPVGVFAADLMLHIISIIGSDGASGKVLEFCGPTIWDLSMESRFTLAGMAARSGALTGLIASDETTKAFLAKMGRIASWRPIDADSDAAYERVFEIDVGDLRPLISFPGATDNIRTIDKAEGVIIDQVFFGAAADSRLEDWEVVARLVLGKKKAPGVRFIAAPGSKLIEKQATDAGYYQILAEFGALILPPGIGSDDGHGGVLADGERCLSTGYTNSQIIPAASTAEIYLGSPATIAASAIEGVIANPRKYEKELLSKSFPAMVKTEALKKIAAAAMDSLEQTAAETAKKYRPKLKEASDTVERKAKEIIKKYEPQARKTADELEKSLKTLADDARRTFKEMVSRGKSESISGLPHIGFKTAKKPAAKKKVTKKTLSKSSGKNRSRKTVAKKTAKRKSGPKSSIKKT